MYGIVNKAIEGLVLQEYGENIWEKIKIKSETNVEVFLSNEKYDDSVTYSLAIAAAEVLEVGLEDVLHLLGKYWILKTGLDNYGSLLKAGGSNLMEFLKNLPNFHSRIMLLFPDLEPPTFRISNPTEKGVYVHYYSHRDGLEPFVDGLLHGLSDMFETPIQTSLLSSKHTGEDHATFSVAWD